MPSRRQGNAQSFNRDRENNGRQWEGRAHLAGQFRQENGQLALFMVAEWAITISYKQAAKWRRRYYDPNPFIATIKAIYTQLYDVLGQFASEQCVGNVESSIRGTFNLQKVESHCYKFIFLLQNKCAMPEAEYLGTSCKQRTHKCMQITCRKTKSPWL